MECRWQEKSAPIEAVEIRVYDRVQRYADTLRGYTTCIAFGGDFCENAAAVSG